MKCSECPFFKKLDTLFDKYGPMGTCKFENRKKYYKSGGLTCDIKGKEKWQKLFATKIKTKKKHDDQVMAEMQKYFEQKIREQLKNQYVPALKVQNI